MAPPLCGSDSRAALRSSGAGGETAVGAASFLPRHSRCLAGIPCGSCVGSALLHLISLARVARRVILFDYYGWR